MEVKMKKIFMTRKNGYEKLLIVVCVCVLIIGSITSLGVYGSERKTKSTCTHPNVSSTFQTATEYTHNADSYCFETVEYIYYHCEDCGARWTSRNNTSTTSHNWKEVSSSTKTIYSHLVDGYCFRNVEVVSKKCTNCGTTKEETFDRGTIPHSWREVVDHYDGTYSYLKTQCQVCLGVKSTRKVKGYVEVGLGIIEEKEER